MIEFNIYSIRPDTTIETHLTEESLAYAIREANRLKCCSNNPVYVTVNRPSDGKNYYLKANKHYTLEPNPW